LNQISGSSDYNATTHQAESYQQHQSVPGSIQKPKNAAVPFHYPGTDVIVNIPSGRPSSMEEDADKQSARVGVVLHYCIFTIENKISLVEKSAFLLIMAIFILFSD